MMPSPLEIADAWYSVKDEWIVRRNKALRVKQWEVVHDWGGGIVSDQTRKIVGRFKSLEAAEDRAGLLEDYARGAAVAELLEKME